LHRLFGRGRGGRKKGGVLASRTSSLAIDRRKQVWRREREGRGKKKSALLPFDPPQYQMWVAPSCLGEGERRKGGKRRIREGRLRYGRIKRDEGGRGREDLFTNPTHLRKRVFPANKSGKRGGGNKLLR